ncbi:MAG: hypothetical protein Q8M01_05630 [Rubrivivax sp.]|nr:hypothetical protein [Rubrivivax sp.]
MSAAMVPAMRKTPTRPGAERPAMSASRICAALCVLLAAGCACGQQRKEPSVAAPPVAALSVAPTHTPSAPPVAPPVASPAASPAAPPVAAPRPASAPDAPPTMDTRRATAATAPAAPAATPPLDLKSLETRLRETKAIGVFTKLAVKNQVDDLLDRFRQFYKGRLETSLAELRRAYDLLVLKVLALLQDADPPLASALAASRESIWGILSNHEKFSAI